MTIMIMITSYGCFQEYINRFRIVANGCWYNEVKRTEQSLTYGNKLIKYKYKLSIEDIVQIFLFLSLSHSLSKKPGYVKSAILIQLKLTYIKCKFTLSETQIKHEPKVRVVVRLL